MSADERWRRRRRRSRAALAALDRGGFPRRQRCGARTRSGKPCQSWVIVGGNRCRMHGAGSPAVRARADQRVQEAAVDALTRSLGLPAPRLSLDPPRTRSKPQNPPREVPW